MQARMPKGFSVACMAVVLLLLCLFIGCGQASALQSSGESSSSSGSSSAAEAPSKEDGSSSIFDALKGLFGGAKEKAEDVAEAVTNVKEDVGKRVSDWQKQQEQAAKDRALGVLKDAKLKHKAKALEYSKKKANP